MRYHDTLPPGTLIHGEFRIERLLGSGGFANTYLALDIGLGRKVAIKEYFPRDVAVRTGASTITPKSDQHVKEYLWGLDRFTREAKVIARFRHPNIVRVLRVIDTPDTAYMVLEYVEGADMAETLKRSRAMLQQADLDRLLHSLLEALDVVHGAGVLHRDIKPANIYIRAADQSPVLLDFGASKFSFGEMKGTTNAIVSRGYSPQESYATDARLHGYWTDIYGLAATIYFALTRRPPPESTARVLRDEMIPAAMLQLPGFRPTFLAAVDWGLRVQPHHRPRDVRQWRQSLLLDAPSPPLPPDASPFAPQSAVVSGAATRAVPHAVAGSISQHAPAAHRPAGAAHSGHHVASAAPLPGYSRRLPGGPGQPPPEPLSARQQHALTTHLPSQRLAPQSLPAATGAAPAVSHHLGPAVLGPPQGRPSRRRWAYAATAVVVLAALSAAGWNWGRQLLGPGAKTAARTTIDRGGGGGGGYSAPSYTPLPPAYSPSQPPRSSRPAEPRTERARASPDDRPRVRVRRVGEDSPRVSEGNASSSRARAAPVQQPSAPSPPSRTPPPISLPQ